MARINALPSLDIIRGFKGILDFYLWRGLPCVRAWPRWRPARQTDASLAAALLFGAIIKAFSLTHGAMLEQLAPETVGIPRTARDLYVSGVFGNLHEASMSDFLDLLTECRDFLSALQAILNALDSIDTDELVVNVDQSVLPPLAATTTNQATAITALQKIDDLQDALESAALDRLLVRGMDQVFTIEQTVSIRVSQPQAGADNWLNSPAVPAGRYWLITTAVAYNTTRVTNYHEYYKHHVATDYMFHSLRAAIAANDKSVWTGLILLDPTDYLRVFFGGSQAADGLRLHATGYQMTIET